MDIEKFVSEYIERMEALGARTWQETIQNCTVKYFAISTTKRYATVTYTAEGIPKFGLYCEPDRGKQIIAGAENFNFQDAENIEWEQPVRSMLIDQNEFINFMNQFFPENTKYTTLSSKWAVEYNLKGAKKAKDVYARLEFKANNWGENVIQYGKIQKGNDTYETIGNGKIHFQGKSVEELLPALKPETLPLFCIR